MLGCKMIRHLRQGFSPWEGNIWRTSTLILMLLHAPTRRPEVRSLSNDHLNLIMVVESGVAFLKYYATPLCDSTSYPWLTRNSKE
jgi:hypothetical protein